MFRLLFAALALVVFTDICNSQSSGTQHWRSKKVLESIVLINQYSDIEGRWVPFGSGVLIDTGSASSEIYLITNRHIWSARDSFMLEFHSYSISDSLSIYTQYTLTVNTKTTTALMPSTDDSDFVAVPISTDSTMHLGPIPNAELATFEDLQYGDPIEFYGYPSFRDFGLFECKWHLPICRTGSIAYFAPADVYFRGARYMFAGMFLVDGVSMGGNSGGPVFVKRLSTQTDMMQKESRVIPVRSLAGIISKHYPVPAVITIPLSRMPIVIRSIDSSQQTQTPSLVGLAINDVEWVFDDNSNLAVVISIKTIVDYIKTRVKSNSQSPVQK